jgi:hypothetical protein
MKKIVRLTESDLVRLVKRVVNEQLLPNAANYKGRNNPRWIKIFETLKSVGNPKILTFMEEGEIPGQSLNWGKSKSPMGNYAMGLTNTSPKLPKEHFVLFSSDDRELEKELLNWWANKGYRIGRGEVLINFDDTEKIKQDLVEFFKKFPPQ